MAKDTIELLKKAELEAEQNEALAKKEADEIVEKARYCATVAFDEKIKSADSAARRMIVEARAAASKKSEQSRLANENELAALKKTADSGMDEAVNAVINEILS